MLYRISFATSVVKKYHGIPRKIILHPRDVSRCTWNWNPGFRFSSFYSTLILGTGCSTNTSSRYPEPKEVSGIYTTLNYYYTSSEVKIGLLHWADFLVYLERVRVIRTFLSLLLFFFCHGGLEIWIKVLLIFWCNRKKVPKVKIVLCTLIYYYLGFTGWLSVFVRDI